MSKRNPEPSSIRDLLGILQYVRGTLETMQRKGLDVDVPLAVVRDGIERSKKGA